MGKLNSFSVIGNLGGDPELRETKNGGRMVTFGIATERGWGENKETVWLDCKAFCGRDGKKATGDILMEYTKKGNEIFVEGEIDNPNVWTNKNGEAQARTKLTVNKVVLLGGKPSSKERDF